MPAILMDGKSLAASIKQNVKEEVSKLKKTYLK